MDEIELSVNYPSILAKQLQQGEIDMALLPVAAISTVPGARIVSDYGIAADGDVASVAIFSHVPTWSRLKRFILIISHAHL